ncbi:hypothetical protein DM01DRAFT_1340618 [Hesseltinella vesiculosa]|uniref:DUF7905 domain-containing protein n=1 Tax=Hesseltinella vesiculosa TaxID=101127 RepID=A0A1X2G3M7_9FUNG|nr:hypothetical protein DM01DRAFT_1340618 [Hesseltinella vesiculosa]
MSKANAKVYGCGYITEEFYEQFKAAISKLETKSNTNIKFDFVGQSFHITGNSQSKVDHAVHRIVDKLLPLFNDLVDECKFHGTFPPVDLDMTFLNRDSIVSGPDTPSSNTSHQNLTTAATPVSGRPIEFSDDSDNDDAEKRHSPTATPTNNSTTTPKTWPVYYGDTESDGEGSDIDSFKETFKFAKNIANPSEIINGSQSSNKQPTNSLRLIERETDTECYFNQSTKEVTITGTDEDAVKDALERFKVLQMQYKRRRRSPLVLACIHPNPKDTRPFHLYFANLERYRHKDSVHLLSEVDEPLFVLLPVFQADGNFLPPHDLIATKKQRAPSRPDSALAAKTYQPQRTSGVQGGRPVSRPPSAAPPVRPSRPPSSMSASSLAQPMSTMSIHGQSTSPTSPMESMVPQWGNNRISQQPEPATYTSDLENWHASPAQPPQTEDFPSLPGKPIKPTVHKGKTAQRRVMRIIPQKSSRTSSVPAKDVWEECREYNAHNATLVLSEALESARCYKGNIIFGAKLGKVLWRNISPEPASRIWQKEDIKDVAMKELGITPMFSDVTTNNDDVIDGIAAQLPDPFGKTACFEIHAQARNQPTLPYQPIIMTLNPGGVMLTKVVVKKDRLAEVDWVMNDNKLDFQMYLDAEELGRTDVKPYSTFEKKISVNIENKQMSFENIPDFLSVNRIFYKETTKYRLHFPFIAEITRVEQLPLDHQPSNQYGVDKITAMTGEGEVWYDCQVYCTSHNEFLKRNISLPIGKLATWKVSDILGDDNTHQTLVDYISCLLIILAEVAKSD